MKKTLFVLLFILSGVLVFAQSQKPVNNNSANVEFDSSPAKDNYISTQSYLKTDSKFNPGKFSADSLAGFDESAVRAMMVTNNIVGEEALNYMIVLKRQYIKDKYFPKTGFVPNYNFSNSSFQPGKSLGNSSNVNFAPCVNEGFELTTPGAYTGPTNSVAISGWTISSNQNYCNNATGEGMPLTWNPGSPEVWVLQTPVLNVPYIGTIPNSPLGGSNIIQLQNQAANGLCTKIAQNFPVTTNNSLFQFAFAGAYLDGTHPCCQQPFLKIRMFDCTGTPLSCSNLSLNPTGSSCVGASGYTVTPGPSGNVSWTNWQLKYIDLTPYIGQCLTIEIITSDCSPTGHWASTYFDSQCGGSLICPPCGIGGTTTFSTGPVSFCSGSNQALIAAPPGYSTYSWSACGWCPLPANQTALQTLTITSPPLGGVYTVTMTAMSGCQYVVTNTLSYTQVNIAGVATKTSCIGGASGTGTILGFGSGTGYSYTLTNLNTNAVTTGSTGTQAIIANGLAASVYSIVITGLGSSGCGQASTAFTITNGPQQLIDVLKPFCPSTGVTQAFLTTQGGSNFQWYNNIPQAITGAAGTASMYIVTSPQNGQNYYLRYTSIYGCQDTVRFTLVTSVPGSAAVQNISWVCPGGNNGTAMVNLAPAPGAPPGMNGYTVMSTGLTPTYSAVVSLTSSNTFPLSGLSAGSYSVNSFDGSCFYANTFNVLAYTYNWDVSPQTVSLCPGAQVGGAITFTPSTQLANFTYSWSPGTWILGGPANLTFPSVIFSPSIPAGAPVPQVYTITVTPNIVNCPTTKTISVTAYNPPTPTINTIPDLCNTFAPYQISANPPGGVFSSGISGANNPVTVNGVITPSLYPSYGIKTVTYTTTQYICSTTTTRTFEVSQFFPATLTSTVSPLCVTSPPFNLMNIVQSAANGTWTGQGVQGSSGSYVVNPALLNNPNAPTTSNYVLTYSTTSSPNPNTCPASSNVNVAITKTLVPNIVPVPPFCTNSGPKNMTVTPGGGTWAHTMISPNGVITPSLAQQNQIPTSQAIYTVAVGPCVNTAVTTLTVSQFNTAALNSPLPNLCINSPTMNLMSYAQSTVNGTWSGPVTNGLNSVINNVFTPSSLDKPNTSVTNTYVLYYNTTSSPIPNLCNHSTSVVVHVYDPEEPQISNVGPLCSSNSPVQLSVYPAIGYWTTSNYVNSNGVFDPAMAAIGNNPVQYVIGSASCSAQQTKLISVEAFVSAKISSPLPDQCSTGSPVSLQPLTMSSGGTWSGPGVSGTMFNPGLTGSGTFTIMHSTSSSPSGLCPDQAVLAVNVFSLATPEITKVGPFCSNALPSQLIVTPVGGMFGGSNLGVVSLQGKFNPASAAIGDNLINYSITSGPCVAYAQTTITVDKFISADFTGSVGPICYIENETPEVNMNHYVVNPGGIWSGDGIRAGTSMFNPADATKGKFNQIVYYTQSAMHPTLCPDQKTIMVEVRRMPKVDAFSNSITACTPAEIVFNTTSVVENSGGTGIWNFDDGSAPESGIRVTHIYTTPGTYQATFTYKDDIGCEAKPAETSNITIYESPKADFTFPDEIYISSPDVQFTNLTNMLGNNSYQWTTGAFTFDEVHPVITFDKIGRYQITLQATAPLNGCKDEVTKMIEVKNNFNIFIPSSFTPNFDGLNDTFIPVFTEYGLDLKSFDMEIFDRWGHSIYRTRDVTKGWDGSVQNKGEFVKQGAYNYLIKYKDLDGNSYEKQGSVTILK